jgi:hypothetical protein
LKNKTNVLSGKIHGQTQLPIPSGAENCDDELKLAER